MNPHNNGHDPRDNPLYGTPNFPPSNIPNNPPSQQHLTNPHNNGHDPRDNHLYGTPNFPPSNIPNNPPSQQHLMNPHNNGHDPRDDPLYGTPNFPPSNIANNSPSQQHFFAPQPQQHFISQMQPFPLGHVSNSSFSQHRTFGSQSQQHSTPQIQAIIERPIMPQPPLSFTGQSMSQIAPLSSQPYPKPRPQSAPRVQGTMDLEALMDHSPRPQSSFQKSPLNPYGSTSNWMELQESPAQSKVQEPKQNFTPNGSGAQSSFYGPPPKEQSDAQKSHPTARLISDFDMSSNMPWDEPQDDSPLNQHDEQLGQDLSSEKRPSVSSDSSSLPKRQRLSGPDLDNTETTENGNGDNSMQFSELGNVEAMKDHSGDNSSPLSELNNVEAMEDRNGDNSSPLSELINVEAMEDRNGDNSSPLSELNNVEAMEDRNGDNSSPLSELNNVEAMEDRNGDNSSPLSELNNVEAMEDHNGDNSIHLSKLDNAEAMEVGNGHNPASDLRGQLLSRNYFVFYLGRSLITNYSIINAATLRSVCHYINRILPTVTAQDISKAYMNLVDMEKHNPAMDGKSFDYRLRNRFVRLAQYLGFDSTRVADICQKLVVIYNSRPANVEMLEDGLGFQPLITHLYSLRKKVIFMADFKGNNGDAMFKGHLDLLMAETINMVQIPIPCMLARAPVYMRNVSGDHILMTGDVLKTPATVSGSKEDQVLKMVMEDLSCKEDDTVFMGNSAHHIEPLTLRGLLQVDLTGPMGQSQLSSTQGMRYKVDTYTTLKKILADEF
ncbi:hypothetical protein OCU04_005509 [Sclerotinia nivalis]|uniref:Uncharacterized protein n=1 Tax=Sclerotinia nivalis TaxID=352851 RepID=A0A9X0DL97_9HELO|nr:hypothetical protein OCU04_005509 [Sclerotinia nivalis]